MAFADVRAAFKALIATVTGIGKVHDYRRHTTFWDEFYARHKSSGQLNNWEITREAAAQEIIAVQNAVGTEPYFHDTHTLVLEGHMSLDDAAASEKAFQALVDAIVEKIRKNNRLGTAVLLPESIQVPVIGHRTFGGVLAHFARMTFRAVERVGG